MLNYDELIEQLGNGYILPYPNEVDEIHNCGPSELYNKIAQRCFIIEPGNRADFIEVAKIIEGHLSQEEIHKYKATKEEYIVKAQKYMALNVQDGKEQRSQGSSSSRHFSL